MIYADNVATTQDCIDADLREVGPKPKPAKLTSDADMINEDNAGTIDEPAAEPLSTVDAAWAKRGKGRGDENGAYNPLQTVASADPSTAAAAPMTTGEGASVASTRADGGAEGDDDAAAAVQAEGTTSTGPIAPRRMSGQTPTKITLRKRCERWLDDLGDVVERAHTIVSKIEDLSLPAERVMSGEPHRLCRQLMVKLEAAQRRTEGALWALGAAAGRMQGRPPQHMLATREGLEAGWREVKDLHAACVTQLQHLESFEKREAAVRADFKRTGVG